VAGWLVALPVNTGTIVFILSISAGPDFAATVALGALLGIVSISVFTIVYARSALRFPWPACLGLACLGFVGSTLALSQFPELVVAEFAVALVAVAIALRWVPVGKELKDPAPPPRWELPLRMLTAGLLVLVITTTADALGPRLSGLLSPVPVFTITLVIFTHSRHGPDPVFVFLNGLQYGLFSFAAFCLVVGVLLVPDGVIVSFAAGLAAFLGVYAVIRRLPGRVFDPRAAGSTKSG